MELRRVNPKTLRFDPNNPRRIKASKQSDEMLLANIKAVGIIMPPLVRETDGGLTIIAGERRVKAALKARLSEIDVLVGDADQTDEALIALSENVIRENMNNVDKWRAIEDLIARGLTEEQAGATLGMPLRQVRAARLLSKIHPPMLDLIAGVSPNFDQLTTIAGATIEEQEQAWNRLKPAKGEKHFDWGHVARALKKTRISKAIAKFGPDEEQAFGIVWQDDLFAEGGTESLYTTQFEAFIEAQRAWTVANLPANGVFCEREKWYSEAILPPGAMKVFGTPADTDMLAYFVDSQTGEIKTTVFRPGPVGTSAAGEVRSVSTKVPKPRADITQKGVDMIGDMRTEALHRAILESPLDTGTLLALTLLALSGLNVSVHGPQGGGRSAIEAAVGTIIPEGLLTQDTGAIEKAARQILTNVLSCRTGMSNSGLVARIAGDMIGADTSLPNMATEDFLTSLSKSALEKTALALGLTPGPRAKDSRATIISHVGEGTFVLPEARFAPTEGELAEFERRTRRSEWVSSEDDPTDSDEHEFEDEPEQRAAAE